MRLVNRHLLEVVKDLRFEEGSESCTVWHTFAGHLRGLHLQAEQWEAQDLTGVQYAGFAF